jgi:hypothetical protein
MIAAHLARVAKPGCGAWNAEKVGDDVDIEI